MVTSVMLQLQLVNLHVSMTVSKKLAMKEMKGEPNTRNGSSVNRQCKWQLHVSP